MVLQIVQRNPKLGLRSGVSGFCPRQHRVKNLNLFLPLSFSLFRREIFQLFFQLKELAAIGHSLLSRGRAFSFGDGSERLVEFSTGVSPASDMNRTVHTIVAGIAVRLQISVETLQKCLRVFLTASRRVFIQDNRVFCIAAGSVQPHVAFGFRVSSFLMQNLQFRLICMKQVALKE